MFYLLSDTTAALYHEAAYQFRKQAQGASRLTIGGGDQTV